ncbi:MAG: YbaB/EbfC family nucleoid-associated protein [Treponema sp.]|jgi:DNA-binding YbaB/EbfC family protein|nr:YbaB/EbfC family nucleoid-associated protein [Treponema sp.]
MNINPFDILKNAQKIQEQVGSIQDKLALINATGSAGGGMVEIDITGKLEVLAVRIKPEAVDPEDIAILEELVTAAIGQAMEKIREKISGEIGHLAGGLGIPLTGLGGN